MLTRCNGAASVLIVLGMLAVAEQQVAGTNVMREPNSDAALNMHNWRFNGMGNSR